MTNNQVNRGRRRFLKNAGKFGLSALGIAAFAKAVYTGLDWFESRYGPPSRQPRYQVVGNMITRSLKHEPRAKEPFMQLAVSKGIYERFKNFNRTSRSQGDPQTFTQDSGILKPIVKALENMPAIAYTSTAADGTQVIRDIDIIAKILRFVDANTTYQSDNGFGYAKFPLETLLENEGKGDCEDLSFLAIRMIRHAGRQVGALFEPEHAALAVEYPRGVDCSVMRVGRRVPALSGGPYESKLEVLEPAEFVAPDGTRFVVFDAVGDAVKGVKTDYKFEDFKLVD